MIKITIFYRRLSHVLENVTNYHQLQQPLRNVTVIYHRLPHMLGNITIFYRRLPFSYHMLV